MDTAVELGLRRRGERDLADTGDLRGDDVHHDARRIDGLAAGDIDTRAAHRLPALLDPSAGLELSDPRSRHLRGGGDTHAPDGLVERRADARIEALERLDEVLGRHADRVTLGTVEPRRLLAQRDLAALAHVGDDVGGGAQCFRARRSGAGHSVEEVGGGEVSTAQIDRSEHPSRLTLRVAAQPRVMPETSVRYPMRPSS